MVIPRSISKLINILQIEKKNNFNNRAVIGGLDRYSNQWELEAQSDAIPSELIQQISDLLIRYSNSDQPGRKEVLNSISQEFKIFLENQETSGKLIIPKTVKEDKNSGISSVVKNAPSNMESKPDSEVKRRQDTNIISGLAAPVTVLKGIGQSKSRSLKKMGISSVEDLLHHYPRRYDDYSQLKPINRLSFGEDITVIGTIYKVEYTPPVGKKKGRIEAIITDGTGFLRVFWYPGKYASFLVNKLQNNLSVVMSGKIEVFHGRLIMISPEWEPLSKDHLNTNRIVPVYPLTAGISQRNIRELTFQTVMYWADKIADFLPETIKHEIDLLDLGQAVQQVHYPDNFETLKRAQFRLAFDEIFLLQLGVLRQKSQWKSKPADKFPSADGEIEKIKNQLPFELTGAQNKALDDVRQDLVSGKPMNRLIQGDVGSGKTIIAAVTSIIVNSHGGQCAIMAPTSILAEQHFQTFRQLLLKEDSPAVTTYQEHEIRLLLGSTNQSERNEIKAGLIDGSIKILVGTHALIEGPIQFNNLQFIVIDEQHRFGVTQRAGLRSKGNNPHVMVMTATPIPRSLALTLYGDLDLSVIDELPSGRKPIETRLIHPMQRESAYGLIRSQVEKGHQAFIIYPLVEQGDRDEARAAVEEHEKLQKHVFPELKLGLLHGRMKPDEKENVMTNFRRGNLDILVSTSVVEVGVDVPNATVMIIEGANRFGLAQLHQFRGRIGRGQVKSYCILIPEHEDALENERLLVLEKNNDGFILAEKDLEQRGPGEFLGSRQSGFFELKMAKLSDLHLIEIARRQGHSLFSKDPSLSQPENQKLNVQLEKFWEANRGEVS